MKTRRWTMLGLLALVTVGAAAAALGVRRASHEREADALWRELVRPPEDVRFDPAMVDGLPEPARRYLLHAIAPGTPLARSVRFRMHGAIRLKQDADPLPMRAEQVLAPPDGYIWRARVGRGLLRIRGFDRYADGAGELRWWLWGLVPVVSATGPDVGRSAAGRAASESVFVPSTLLPGRGAAWEAVDDSTVRVRVPAAGETVVLTLHVDPEGRLRRVSFPRWNSDPANGPTGPLRFDVDSFADERTFDGYTIPTRFRAGWRLGEPEEYPFFYATIDTAVYR